MAASPTPPDFIAENANKSEHHAESAYCSDDIGDANKMVSAGLPSEEAFQRLLFEFATCTDLAAGPSALDANARSFARAILDLIRPAFEAKEMHHVSGERITRKDLNNAYREGSEKGRLAAHLIDGVNSPLNACCYRDGCRALVDRALSAEAKLAQAVEALEPFAKLAEAFDKAAEKFGRPLRPDGYIPSVQVSYGDLRRARAAARGEKT